MVLHPLRDELIELVRLDALDDVLSIVTLDEIATAWRECKVARRSDPHVDIDALDWWAIEFFWMQALIDRRDVYRRATLKLLEKAAGDAELITAVAVDPLENFVTTEADVRWLEASAAENPNLREAIAELTLTNASAETLERLDAAAGTRLWRPTN